MIFLLEVDGFITGAITGGITSNHCFVAGTAVVTVSGYKQTENIKAGDKVYAVDSDTGDVSIKNQTGEFTVLGNAESLENGSLKASDLPEIRIWKDDSGK